MKSENTTKATTQEWYASLFGACFIAFALGVFFADIFKGLIVVILLVGGALHAWGMFKIHHRNQ